ncbi:MAG: DegT/DnrJ/EryC1/StrS family aminotransferase [Gammaproteobacteria bacterium]|nr:DegT/DnrJ/EryC1/StrS family aminotransferase [Gammaproteobacteria bacterium]
MIPFIDLKAQQERIKPQIEAAIARVLAHGQYILGPEVQLLEQRLAEFCGAGHVLSCASGTDALILPLMVKAIGPGDAVLVPAFTFVATAEVVLLLGATPVFVDVDPITFLMDIDSLRSAIDEAAKQGLRPRAIIPVDLFGQPADYETIGELAETRDLFMLADAAQSFGAARAGKRVGTLAPMTATSFFPAKPLGCYGDGGAVFVDDAETLEILESLRVHGQGKDKYENVRIGVNGRCDTLQAAILLEKLAIFEEEIAWRQRVADRYNDALADIAQTPVVVAGSTSVWAQYTIRLNNRDHVAAQLKESGVPTAIYYPIPLHRQVAYQGFPTAPGGLPVSEKLAGEVLSLPMHPYLSKADQDMIIAAVTNAVAKEGNRKASV